MDTIKLKKFAQFARRTLLEQIAAKLALVLDQNSAARRENPKAVEELMRQIQASSVVQVIDKVAYTWFNRFCALRFMDVNRFTRIGVVSPAEGQFQPEILAEAKMGHIDDGLVSDAERQRITALLEGSATSHDPQGEAYRLLLVAACNAWHQSMPFLFERIHDYTELLMPDDLLSGNSILAYTREAMTPDACIDVEVIGWLYQFYISEKKDAVFEGLKKNQKITPENIPAATQLFTPHWIVRYLVENSLGRLWLLNRPASRLAEQMEYYIPPEQPETDFLRINSPEDIKVCDPACGSGHMLTYAFDLLYTIYEEEGYDPAAIPEKILTHNLYGIELDERAGELAAFALTMKARAKQRRFFSKGIKPNICVLETVAFDADELADYMEFVGRDLFTEPFHTTLQQFEEVDNFGSLVRPVFDDVDNALRLLKATNISSNLFLSQTHQKVLQVLRQVDFLSQKYHIVVANPPYMGAKGMNGKLGKFLSLTYPNEKADLMTAFMKRSSELCMKYGYWSMINLPSWMFLNSFEATRDDFLRRSTITSLLHLGRGLFGPDFGTVAFNVKNCPIKKNEAGIYRRLFENHVQVRTPEVIESLFKDTRYGRYEFKQAKFCLIPGQPIVYWLSESMLQAFELYGKIGDFARAAKGMVTANNDYFVREWFEVEWLNTAYGCKSRSEGKSSGKKWFPYAKGGSFRKWNGNRESVVNWQNDGYEIQTTLTDDGKRVRATNTNLDRIFIPGITWTSVTSGSLSFRYLESGFLFDAAGGVCQGDSANDYELIGFLNSPVAHRFLNAINPTLNLPPGYLESIPYIDVKNRPSVENLTRANIQLSLDDWAQQETAWDFTCYPLLHPDRLQPTLKASYQSLRTHWREMTLDMQRLERENNRIFIEAYGLQDELTPEVPLNEITLTCNPHYRYGGNKSEEELEALLLADTMRELVSYAVGCMFGRYSLDKPGLILANQCETLADYLAQVPAPSFPADDDNVIPLLDGDWFADDVTLRFRQFLRVAFGDAHYEDNLAFIEQALNVKGKRNYGLRDYFLGEFYTDHVKRYKKRPIYWLFSSPRGSFNALVYMHRYRPDTVSVVLRYLREFRAKLLTEKERQAAVSINSGSSQGEKTKALKEVDRLAKVLAELDDYERDTLYPLATEQKAIDLDDGVKVNYLKFGAALKKITGLEAKDED